MKKRNNYTTCQSFGMVLMPIQNTKKVYLTGYMIQRGPVTAAFTFRLGTVSEPTKLILNVDCAYSLDNYN